MIDRHQVIELDSNASSLLESLLRSRSPRHFLRPFRSRRLCLPREERRRKAFRFKETFLQIKNGCSSQGEGGERRRELVKTFIHSFTRSFFLLFREEDRVHLRVIPVPMVSLVRSSKLCDKDNEASLAV